MSEQIQSLLNEMEEKFEKSFSQTNLQEPLNKQLNPQSAKKNESKHQNIHKISSSQHHDFSQVENLLLSQFDQNEEQNGQIYSKNVNLMHQLQHDSNENIHNNAINGKKENTSNFKIEKQIPEQEIEDLRKTTSEQHFSKITTDTAHLGEQNQFYYKQLTMKLQKALQKISSEKSVGQMKKSYSFYDRIQQFQTKKKRQIQRRKQQLQEKQINQVKDRPLINSHSRAIVSQISNDPIYVRCDRIIQKRKEKQLENQRIKEEREIKEYEKFKEQFDAHMDQLKQKYQSKGIRSPEEYYNEMLTWTKHKQRNIESKIEQQNQKLKNQNTFKPLINSKSQKIILSKKQQKRVPIFDRQPKQKEQVSDPNCTFKPKINKSNFYKKMNYYQSAI